MTVLLNVSPAGCNQPNLMYSTHLTLSGCEDAHMAPG